MILLAHMVFGAAIGYTAYSLTNNIWLAIVLAYLSHYFLDVFPHIEYLESVESAIKQMKEKDWKGRIPDAIKVFIDFCLGLLLILLFSKNYIIIYIYAFVAIVPDGVTVIYTLFPNSLLARHQKFHGAIQYLTKKKKFSKFWRIATQALAVVISIVLLRG